MLRKVRDVSTFIGLVIYVVLASLFKVGIWATTPSLMMQPPQTDNS